MTTNATTGLNPGEHIHPHQDEDIHVFVQLSLRGVNGTCLQCLKFPNRPLNYFRDAIFKAYDNSWILMLPEYIYI